MQSQPPTPGRATTGCAALLPSSTEGPCMEVPSPRLTRLALTLNTVTVYVQLPLPTQRGPVCVPPCSRKPQGSPVLSSDQGTREGPCMEVPSPRLTRLALTLNTVTVYVQLPLPTQRGPVCVPPCSRKPQGSPVLSSDQGTRVTPVYPGSVASMSPSHKPRCPAPGTVPVNGARFTSQGCGVNGTGLRCAGGEATRAGGPVSRSPNEPPEAFCVHLAQKTHLLAPRGRRQAWQGPTGMPGQRHFQARMQCVSLEQTAESTWAATCRPLLSVLPRERNAVLQSPCLGKVGTSQHHVYLRPLRQATFSAGPPSTSFRE
ncbi:hypothetical protein TREES_T100009655 [Tupaia chinensis]|uniref:Uncharacterized protein n=1 Tax=Tupaia chinensis TaxID=246437 RepID=L9LC33_TUPCH|nr:hypothetical protein TREES_T100009655 [Tupaia chinensis]